MIEARGRQRFLLEAVQPLGIVGKAGGQDLDRDLALQPWIGGAIHLAHPARPERRDDFVGAEPHTWRQRHYWIADRRLQIADFTDVRLPTSDLRESHNPRQ